MIPQLERRVRQYRVQPHHSSVLDPPISGLARAVHHLALGLAPTPALTRTLTLTVSLTLSPTQAWLELDTNGDNVLSTEVPPGVGVGDLDTARVGVGVRVRVGASCRCRYIRQDDGEHRWGYPAPIPHLPWCLP